MYKIAKICLFVIVGSLLMAEDSSKNKEIIPNVNLKDINKKKVNQWLDDPEMSKYLRPETLYGKKFEGYLNEVSLNQVNKIKPKPKYQTADERRIENNKQTFNKALQEAENGTIRSNIYINTNLFGKESAKFGI